MAIRVGSATTAFVTHEHSREYVLLKLTNLYSRNAKLEGLGIATTLCIPLLLISKNLAEYILRLTNFISQLYDAPRKSRPP